MRYIKPTSILKILAFVAIILLVSCEESNEGVNLTKNIIVEGYLYPGNSVRVSINRLLYFESTDSAMQPIDTCHITLRWRGRSYPLSQEGNGYYSINDTSLRIQSGDSIVLQLYNEQLVVSSATIIPSKPSQFKASVSSIAMPDFSGGFSRDAFQNFEPIELTWANADNSYYMIAVQPVDSNATLINPKDTLLKQIRIFRNEPAITDNYRLEPFQFRYYGYNYVILYHINPEYAALYKFTGNTSLNIREPYSNIENGLGIFTGINADTLRIYVY